jgi:hypothetical protein
VVLLVHNPVVGITSGRTCGPGTSPDGDGWQPMVPGDQALSAGSREQLAGWVLGLRRR